MTERFGQELRGWNANSLTSLERHMYREHDKDTKPLHRLPTALESNGPENQDSQSGGDSHASRNDAAQSGAGQIDAAAAATRTALPRPAIDKRTMIASAGA